MNACYSRVNVDKKVGMGDEGERRRRGQQAGAASSSAPCGACKFLRRKCKSGCIFAPYFGSEQGAARFAAVHKVFGASNVSKLLTHIPTARRHDAVLTISYEAQARLSDPVYGCVSTILALQHQVANLQAELSIVQSQLNNSRVALESSQQVRSSSSSSLGMGVFFQQQQHQRQQPTYSNNSSGDISACCFAANYDILPSSSIPPPPPLLVDPYLRLSTHDHDHHPHPDDHPFSANHIVR